MENERPSKRHSLLPQRSASAFSNSPSENDEAAPRLAPPAAAKNRDVSPSKLPVGGGGGGLRKVPATRHLSTQSKASNTSTSSSSSSRAQAHKAQSTSVSHFRAGSGSSSQTPSTTRRGALVKPGAPATRQTSDRSGSTPLAARSSAHKPSASLSSATRSTSPVKDGRPSTRILANVKVQRPAVSAALPPLQKPTSPRKPTVRQPSGPVVNKYALLSTPPTPAQRPVQDLKLELLHLHMLHKNAAPTKDQWTASARTHYEKVFNRLVTMEDELRTGEIDFLQQRNAAALIEWLKEVTSATGESKTRVLSGVLDQMWMIVAPGGRYTAAVAAFEDWFAIMERSHDLRKLGHERQHVDIMEGLGDGWKTEVEGLMSSLCLMSDALEGLGPALEPSDLARCLNVLMTLLANMLDELMLIRDIEQKLVDREGSWMKGKIEGISARISGDG